ncbi:hypothetical protein ACTMTJ_21625 [Phytohabitans sp. LJ34]|uniref:hypothetical protein n=1 Tax=Phytohabitans sp. LJ34 TaxID=3452217 RepID=UPI003F89EF00
MSFQVPDACTLPAAGRPLRLAAFDELFVTAVRRVEPVTAEHVRMWLSGPAGLVKAVRDLTAREAQCCSFFTFTVTPEPADVGEALRLDIAVPARYTGVLESLGQRAAAKAS